MGWRWLFVCVALWGLWFGAMTVSAESPVFDTGTHERLDWLVQRMDILKGDLGLFAGADRADAAALQASLVDIRADLAALALELEAQGTTAANVSVLYLARLDAVLLALESIAQVGAVVVVVCAIAAVFLGASLIVWVLG